MIDSKSLYCSSCNSIILKISNSELKKLDGLCFECECCGHDNLLFEGRLDKVPTDIDSFSRIHSLRKNRATKQINP